MEFQKTGKNILSKEICLKYISSFICAKKLQEDEKCEDFEVRFCCPKPKSLIPTTDSEKPVFDDKEALQELGDLKDLRKLST